MDLKGPTSKGREDGAGGEGMYFSLYLRIHRLQKGLGKFVMDVLEKSWIFFSKTVGTLMFPS